MTSDVGSRYLVAIRVPREVEVRIEDRYLGIMGLTKPAFSYHITLIGPMYLRAGAERDLEEQIARLCARWEPFEVTLGSLEIARAEDNHFVYLSVREPERIASLRGYLLKQVLPVIRPENDYVAQVTLAQYLPHITLGMGLTDDELSELSREDTGESLDARFSASSLWMAEQSATNPWRYTREFPLGGLGSNPEPTTPRE